MDKSELLKMAKAVICRNQIILTDFRNKTRKNTLNLHWWKLPGEEQNVGDYLSTVVVDHMLRENSLTSADSSRRTTHLYAIGSIIDGGYQDATVWGSGLLRGKERYWWSKFRKLDIRCVRGPETRRMLLSNGYQCPEVYGDPAVLMPLFYHPADNAKVYPYRVVPHMVFGSKYPNCLTPYTDNWKAFIDEIVRSELVISSSLHGIILAEAYGVPAILLNDHDMNLFKYRDYYLSTGRDCFPIARSVEEALSMDPAPVPDLSALRKNLLASFPTDLWQRH